MNASVHAIPAGQGRPGDSCVMVIFGATGDLTQRKLLPALYNLAKAGRLSRKFAVIGAAVDPLGADTFREHLLGAIRTYATDELDAEMLVWFEKRID